MFCHAWPSLLFKRHASIFHSAMFADQQVFEIEAYETTITNLKQNYVRLFPRGSVCYMQWTKQHHILLCRKRFCTIDSTHFTLSHPLINSWARPMYRHADVHRPIWQCCRCIVSASSADIYRQHLLIKVIRCFKCTVMPFSCSWKVFGWRQNSSRSVYFASWVKTDSNTKISVIGNEKRWCRPKKIFELYLIQLRQMTGMSQ